MAGMGLLEAVAPNLADVIRSNMWWMGWNTLLAWIPVGLAFALFRLPWVARRGAGGVEGSTASASAFASDASHGSPLWWVGMALFVLFLPNAPYVATDLIHLRDDVQLVGRDGPVVTAVLPIYAAFIASGFLAYYLSLAELGRYLTRIGRGRWRPGVMLGAHVLCAVGVFLGRWARLNSWEPVVEPEGTLDRVVLILSWRWAPVLIFAVFVVTAFGHFVTKAVVEAAWDLALRANRRFGLL
jgi:uncharacterized membrane protein